jgi:uncharacterized protein (TIGR02611 family)
LSEDEPQIVPEEKPSRYRTAKRWARIVMGFTVILFGLLLAIPGVPGPGFLVVIAGLAILATEYVWARRYLNRIKEGGEKLGAIFFRRKEPKPPDKDA